MPINGHETRSDDRGFDAGLSSWQPRRTWRSSLLTRKKYDVWVAVGLKCYVPMLVEAFKGNQYHDDYKLLLPGDRMSLRQRSPELSGILELGLGENRKNYMNFQLFQVKM